MCTTWQILWDLRPQWKNKLECMCENMLMHVSLCCEQAVWCGRSEVGEEEVDPLFRGCHSHHFLCGSQRIRPGAARGRDHGKERRLHVYWVPPLSLCSPMTHLHCKILGHTFGRHCMKKHHSRPVTYIQGSTFYVEQHCKSARNSFWHKPYNSECENKSVHLFYKEEEHVSWR